MDSITDLLNHHTARLSAEFKSSFQIVESKLNLIQSTLEHQEERIKSLETAAEDVAQRVTDLEERCSTLQVSNEHLRTKVCDLEGRSRRQNIRVVGLEESVEGTRPSEFFPSFLCEVFGAAGAANTSGNRQGSSQSGTQAQEGRKTASGDNAPSQVSG